ncbi:ABC transporter permease subunit, partial [Dermacoccus nishinomiyaensis]|uniref:ABC transporter permease subunit n=1 Tax=Dermacoccus nishinomiyaensis TaxID=1274 RepID=UPI00248DB8BC
KAGIATIPVGQAEAARAIGLTFNQTLSEVILPQAFRTVIPPLGSVVIAMLKNTSIASAFNNRELMSAMRNAIELRGDMVITILLATAVVYLVLALVLGTVIAAMRISPVASLRWFAAAWTELARNTPLTLVFFFFAFVMPFLGVRVPYLALAIAAERPDTQVVLYEELPYLWHGSADDAVAELCDSRDLVATPWSEQVDTDAKFARLRAYTSQMPVMDTVGRLLAARHLPTRERYWLLTPSSRPTPS